MDCQPSTLESGLVKATASSDKNPPTCTIMSVSLSSTKTGEKVVAVLGTATDSGGNEL